MGTQFSSSKNWEKDDRLSNISMFDDSALSCSRTNTFQINKSTMTDQSNSKREQLNKLKFCRDDRMDIKTKLLSNKLWQFPMINDFDFSSKEHWYPLSTKWDFKFENKALSSIFSRNTNLNSLTTSKAIQNSQIGYDLINSEYKSKRLTPKLNSNLKYKKISMNRILIYLLFKIYYRFYI